MDPDLVSQLNNAHARGIAASAGVDASANQVMQQLNVQIAVAAEYDQRLLNGFLASQLFNLGVVEAKTAYDTPRPSGAGAAPFSGVAQPPKA